MATLEHSRTLTTVNPATGETIARYGLDERGDVERKLAQAVSAQREWRATSLDERALALRAIATTLRDAVDEISQLITTEMGKTITEARGEVEKTAWLCEYCADHGAEQLAPDLVATDWARSYVQFVPLGVVLAIMPWNYPLWQVVRAMAPAVMAGNTILLKHASNVTGCALKLRDLVERATGRRHLLEVVLVDSSDVAGIIADERVAAVTLTGSEAVGIAVAEVCARNLKPSVLELGGSDPFVVLADADIEAAAAGAVTARFGNAGQSCIAGKRLVVVEAVADAFEEAFAERVRTLAVADPLDDATDVGPMARADLRDELADQLDRGLREGGRLVAGRGPLDRPGAWFEPAIVGGVAEDNPLAREETFGPLAAVMRVTDEREAIRVANASPYGLSSSVWSADVERARSLASEIEAGAVFINTPSASDPRMPFGGVKRSGWGRELGSYGIKEFVNVQAVTVAPRRQQT